MDRATRVAGLFCAVVTFGATGPARAQPLTNLSGGGAAATAGITVDGAATGPNAAAREGGTSNEDRTSFEGVIDPAAYLVGPGDRLLVSLWGLRDFQSEAEVNAEGRLFVPRVGIFDAKGKTLAALKEEVSARLQRVYPNLRGGLTLSRPRTFRVQVTGAVARPGSYTATALTHVSALVARAGGTLPQGSSRRVEVRRAGAGGAQTVTADLMRLTLLGLDDRDPAVLDGDVVFVPLRGVDVEVSGAVRRPGRYELIEGRDVGELLQLAGGIASDMARDLPLRVSERVDGDRYKVRSVALTAAATPLKDGARVHVPGVSDLRRTVLVQGAIVGDPTTDLAAQRAPQLIDRHADAVVSAPRDVSVTLPFVEGDTVRDLLNKVNGLQPWADAESAFVLRSTEKGPQKRLPVDLVSITSHGAPDVPVREGDTLVVPARRQSIMVSGAVQRPGLYQYSPELGPDDYILLAGGATRSGDSAGARVVSHAGGSKPIDKVAQMEPGDSIAVPEKRFTTAEWVEMTLILANLAVGVTAVTLSATK